MCCQIFKIKRPLVMRLRETNQSTNLHVAPDGGTQWHAQRILLILFLLPLLISRIFS